ncbi:MAG: LPP20 family lipoprotein [Spirochaetaceae bacterium]|nr:LPP20 family lipoprotein [Spirochaetaceae bacterium]
MHTSIFFWLFPPPCLPSLSCKRSVGARLLMLFLALTVVPPAPVKAETNSPRTSISRAMGGEQGFPTTVGMADLDTIAATGKQNGKAVYLGDGKKRNGSTGAKVNLDSRVSGSVDGREADYPEWLLNPPRYEGFIVGIGVSSSSNQSIALAQAQTRARVAIAQTLSANVQAMLVYYKESSGSGDSFRYCESISRVIGSVDISGAVIKKIYIASKGANKGTVYCLAALKLPDAKKLVVDAASAAGVLAEFNAINALDQLDEQFTKNDVKPAVKDN